MTFHFAYGSNMSLAAMQARCPGARVLGVPHPPANDVGSGQGDFDATLGARPDEADLLRNDGTVRDDRRDNRRVRRPDGNQVGLIAGGILIILGAVAASGLRLAGAGTGP